uniref:ATP-binding cassette domain-containing protein n=1 Tax=Parolsenella massiliensis TaxID=1871022 RepID=UPI00093409A9|nr:ABC transporter ATP-binding protein [Parolsenella massiliensis]
MAKLVELSGASRRVSDSFSLCNVSLDVEPGEIMGFVGANGAGKTTTMRAILGLLRLDAGDLRVFGEPFGADASDDVVRRVRSRVGVVLDTCPFPTDHTVAQAAACVSPAYPTWNREKFDELADSFGLDQRARVKELSRGMGMKLQLACALAHDADLLLLDEATAGLDPIARDEVLDMLRDYAGEGERGVLLSSHITSDFERIADRVVAIDGGAIVFDVPRERITDEAGVARCAASRADEILSCVDGARARRRAYSTDVLVPNRFEFAEAFPDVACDRASIDDYLHFYLKESER